MNTVFLLLENHFFKTPDGRIWCDRIINYMYLQSYLQTFDKLVLCGRCMDISKDNIKDKNLVSGKGVSFVGLPDFVGAMGIVRNSLKVRRIIKENLKNVDCAIIRGPSPLSLATYPVFKKSRKPFAVEFVMAADRMFDSERPLYKIANKILVRRAKNMCLTADGVAYVTKHVLQKTYPCKKAAFTANYLDIKQNFFYEQKWDANTPPKCFNIVHTGYMDSNRKGQDTLIEAARRMLKAGQTNFKITFIGDGKMRTKLEKMVVDCELPDYVKFVGAINDENEIRDILIKSHLFVFPSYSEGLPRVLIEAMSVGLVCIASAVDGIPEIISRRYLVSSNKSDEYAKKIIATVNDWPGMIIESRNNSEKAKEFDKSILDGRRKEFYGRLREMSERVNVLNVVGGMDIGGAETMLMNVLRTIDRKKFKLFFLCYSDKKYDYEDEINRLGGTILRIHRGTPFRDIRKIKRIIKENNISVVHSHTYHNSAIAVIAAKRAGAKTILTHSHTTKPKPARAVIRKIYYALATFIINCYSDFLVSCGERASEGIFRDKNKIYRFNNGIIIEDFKFSERDRERIRNELGIDGKTKVIGHVGRFTEAKNHKFILDVFYEYAQKDPNSILLLVGNGELLTEVKRRAQKLGIDEKVRFLGLRNDTNKIYSAMDALLFPSLFEGLPLTLIEAQANGLPIIASNRIDRAVNLTGHVKFLSLERPFEHWVCALESSVGNRFDDFSVLWKSNYDMTNEVKKLERLYIRGLEKCR